jgi:hypothetical protein
MKTTTSRILSRLGLPLLVLAFGMGACSDDDSPGPGQGNTGSIRVVLTDAPFPFDMIDSAVVAIDSVSVHLVASEEGGFRTIDRTPRNLDLLQLQGGTVALLAEAVLPVGEIDQIRLYVHEATITLLDQRTFPLETPSGSQSGIKVFPSPPIPVVGDITTELLLDFDVSQSFSPIPNSPNQVADIQAFVFHPVLRVAVSSQAGSLSGTVWNGLGTAETADDVPLPGATVTALQGEEEIAATASDGLGHYVLVGLPAGSYTVRAEAIGFTATDLAATVVAGNEIDDQDLRLQPE